MADEQGSWLESLKHYVSAPRRAFESMARPPADPNSPIEYATSSPLVNISRQDIDNATEAAMAVSGGGMKTDIIKPPPIRTFHSSPHDFAPTPENPLGRFDLAKMGTGEGAQVYGPGMYLAESPAVSGRGGQYWNQFLRRFEGTPEGHAAAKLKEAKFDREAALNDSKWNLDQIKDYVKHYNPQTYDEVQRWHHFNDKLLPLRQAEYDALASGKPVGPRTYEVDIHADPKDLLHWDKPLDKQNVWERLDSNVRHGIDEVMDERMMAPMSDALEAYTGRELYQALKHHDVHDFLPPELPGSSWYTGATTEAKHTAAYLDSLGIPGVKFLDQASRGIPEEIARYRRQLANPGMASHHEQIAKNLADWEAKPQTHNYAIWRDSILDVVKKYGLAGIAGAPPLAGALRDKDKQ